MNPEGGSSMLLDEDHDRWRIVLYYCYIDISNVQGHIDFQQQLCEEKSLKGRVRVATEGLNGVLSGLHNHLIEYESRLRDELTLNGVTFELDVKYCLLRSDLPVFVQLFGSLQVQATKHVICLVDEPKLPKRNNRESSSIIHKIWAEVQINESVAPSTHLTPIEWNKQLQTLQDDTNSTVVLIDCRNYYESAIGYFDAPSTSTVLTNTRKYSELPQVFVEQADRLASSTHIFMYCTGGVRCERASMFLQQLMNSKGAEPKIYQLRGGIQRYLEQPDHALYYKGKNFVFDPRRTDPHHMDDIVVGRCLVCHCPHDDYDNGQAPLEGTEARCVNCRILLLVCPACRFKVKCWGQEEDDDDYSNKNKPLLFCGGINGQCLHKPPVRVIANASSVAL